MVISVDSQLKPQDTLRVAKYRAILLANEADLRAWRSMPEGEERDAVRGLFKELKKAINEVGQE